MDYYENILRMDGASGIPRSSTFKRKFNSISANTGGYTATDGEGDTSGGEGDAEADATQ